MNFPTLSRNRSDIAMLKMHHTPNSVIIYPEGTRNSVKKHQESVLFAKKESIPISNHCLVPKSKGCLALLEDSSFEYVTFSFILYFNKEWKFIPYIGNTRMPENVYIHNTSYLKSALDLSPEKFKIFLQNEFANVDKVIHSTCNSVNVSPPSHKLLPQVNFVCIVHIIFILSYPICIAYALSVRG